MLRQMCGKTMMDKVKNEDIRSLVKVAPIEDKMRENRLRYLATQDVDQQMHLLEGWRKLTLNKVKN